MDLIDAINHVIQSNMEAQSLTDLSIGIVETVNPLGIRISTELPVLPEGALYLCDSVKSRTENVKATSLLASLITGLNEGDIIGIVDVNSGLSVGDQVIMIRAMKGQSFIVLSKI